jgi:diguanylate cyclase (GGDEF)-like protein
MASVLAPHPQAASTAPSDAAALRVALAQALAQESQDAPAALQWAEALATQAEALADPLLLHEAWLVVGQLQASTGQYPQAMELFLRCQGFFEANPTPDLLAKAYNGIGLVYGNTGQIESALTYYQKAFEATTNPRDRLNYRAHMAIASGNLGYWQQAAAEFKDILHEYQYNVTPDSISSIFGIKVYALYCLQKFAEAKIVEDPHLARQNFLEVIEKSTELLIEVDKHGIRHLNWEIYEMIAQNHFNLGDMKAARTAALEVERQAIAVGRPDGQISSLLIFADVELADQRYMQSINCFQKALEIAEDIGVIGIRTRIYNGLTKAYAALGQFEPALRYHRLFHEFEMRKKSEAAARRAELFSLQLVGERNRLEAQYQRERAETLERLNQQLLQQSHTDVLTGIANRRYFREVFDERFYAAVQTNTIVSVVIFDLDHFKQINDRFSHAIGDAVLARVGEVLRQHEFIPAHPTIAARYGGEEFVLLFIRDAATTVAACEHLRQAIANHAWGEIHPQLAVSASFGVAQYAQDPSPDHLLARADAALYTAKAAGRNRVILASGPAPA